MDLSKAYDCIPHDLFIAKLGACELDKSSLRFILNYLSNRIQRVNVGTYLSRCGTIKNDFLQGPLLGSLLFNMFINGIFYMNLNCNICNFADDTTFYSCKQSIDIVITEVEKTLKLILSCGMVATLQNFK